MARPELLALALPVTVAAHTTDEALRAPAFLRQMADRLPLPIASRLRSIDSDHLALYANILTATANVVAFRGLVTGGASRLYQTAVAAYGVHALGHIAASVATGRKVPGLMSSLTLAAAPAAILLARQGVRDSVESGSLKPIRVAVAASVGFAAAHVLAHVLRGVVRRYRATSQYVQVSHGSSRSVQPVTRSPKQQRRRLRLRRARPDDPSD